MMKTEFDSTSLAQAADFLLRDYLRLAPSEEVLLTADLCTDMTAVLAVAKAARVLGAKVCILTIPQLPYQGKLADPYLTEAVSAGLSSCDVWVDFNFPYISGSAAHAQALAKGRMRSVNILDLGPDGLIRLFGGLDFDRLFSVQTRLDNFIAAAEGKRCRVLNDQGTDVTFVLGKPKAGKLRHQSIPGTTSPPGSTVIMPDPASVKGKVVVNAVFHEWYARLDEPLTIDVDGDIRRIAGGGSHRKVFEAALRRASGGALGSIIHFSHGFHPRARFTGKSFNEDIRVRGNDAIGFGTPWWEEGGGENHPDAVCTEHSLYIDEILVIDHGVVVAPGELSDADEVLARS
ncbi:hypothetical protein AB4Z34_35365 [Ensifer sp. 2YAB10]|uniref:hypothetical protein n=1 Tax=Pseudomonadota TaxID=1224 RepID=UPI0039F6E344